MKRHWIALAILLIWAQSTAFSQDIDWQTDLDLAKTIAAEQDKLVLLHFSADWCRPCKQLETFVFTSPKVVSAIDERVVAVRIDTDLHPELVKQYDVSQIPTDIVITPTGRVIQKRQSPKDSANYVRMMQSVDSADTDYSQKNAVIAQKIDDVLQASSTREVEAENDNDFAAKTPTHQQPDPGRNSQQLLAKSKTQARLVEQVANTENEVETKPTRVVTVDNTNPAVTGPKRVINDRFFVEKSNAAGTRGGQKKVAQTTAVTNEREKMGMNDDQSFVPVKSRANSQASVVKPQLGRLQPQALQPATINTNAVQAELQTGRVHSTDQPNATAKIIAAKSAHITGTAVPLRSNDIGQGKPSSNSSARLSPTAVANGRVIQENRTQPMVRQNRTELAPQKPVRKMGLGGKCPVTLMEDGTWVDGNASFGCVHRGKTYLFANHAKLVEFQRDPESFSPILAGYDPVIFHQKGELVEGKEQHGVFMGKSKDQRIVLFSSPETRAQFQKNPRQYMATVRFAIRQSDTLK